MSAKELRDEPAPLSRGARAASNAVPLLTILLGIVAVYLLPWQLPALALAVFTAAGGYVLLSWIQTFAAISAGRSHRHKRPR